MPEHYVEDRIVAAKMAVCAVADLNLKLVTY